MAEDKYNRTTVTQDIEGVEAIVNTEPGEIYIDIPATNPRYIHVREGDLVVEGDIRSRTREELESAALTKWRIESISEDTVTGSDIDTGEIDEWNREWLVKHLSIGEYSVDLRDFGRVSVVATGGWENADSDEQDDEADPGVIVMAYANNGQRFRREYTADRAGDWESLTPGNHDPRIDKFGEELRERFDEAVATALEIEQRYS
ncbi:MULTISPECIES: hypothetical protein [Natrialbaceae]|uniref:hypothetical protein n=1 Tax=Natrialbaceae TaxID=1644061 RepID=UPI00207C5114|nr:hypothetical protein [Natronococcus sp. CG52]